jgi:hypothetical protein
MYPARNTYPPRPNRGRGGSTADGGGNASTEGGQQGVENSGIFSTNAGDQRRPAEWWRQGPWRPSCVPGGAAGPAEGGRAFRWGVPALNCLDK